MIDGRFPAITDGPLAKERGSFEVPGCRLAWLPPGIELLEQIGTPLHVASDRPRRVVACPRERVWFYHGSGTTVTLDTCLNHRPVATR